MGLPHRSLDVRDVVLELWDGYCHYRALVAGSETSALSMYRKFEPREEHRFTRPKAGFVVLSEDRTLSPSLIFSQGEADIVVLHVAPKTASSREVVDMLEYVCGSNRLRVLMLLGILERATAPGGWRRALADLFRRPPKSSLVPLRDAIVGVHEVRSALEARPSIGDATQSGALCVLESLYDVRSHELHFDVSGALAR